VVPWVVPDVNGDGYDDLCIETYDPWNLWRVRVIFGAATVDTLNSVFVDVYCGGDGGGGGICGAGDLNQDGYNDFIEYMTYCGQGALNCYLGHPWLNPQPAFIITGGSSPTNLVGIRSVAALGDINGDSVDDLAIGANDPVPFAGRRGRAVIISGDTTLIVSAEAPPAIPEAFDVSVYPNPFNSSTTFELTLPTYAGGWICRSSI